MRAHARGWQRGSGADGGFEEKDGRHDGPTSSALGALALADRRDARRALAYAISHREPAASQRAAPGPADGLGLDRRRPLAHRAHSPRAARRERSDAGRCRDAARGGRAPARAPVRGRRLELRQRLRLRRRPARLRADDGDGPDRAPAGPRARSSRERSGSSRQNWRARARRADGRAGARRVPPPPAPRRASPSSSPHWSRSRAGPRSARGPSRSRGRRSRPARTRCSSL